MTWRGLAEACNAHLHKGSRVYVTGRLRTRSWQDEGGTTHYRTEVQADTVIFLDGRGQAQTDSVLFRGLLPLTLV